MVNKIPNQYILPGLLLLVIAFLFYRDMQREQQLQALLSRPQPAGKDGRLPADPFMQNQVKNRIIKGYKDLQICYKEFLTTKPQTTDGDLKMDWQIDTDGDVESPEVIFSPFKSEAFHACMAKQIAGWKFPPPPVRKYVTHTFKFEKKE